MAIFGVAIALIITNVIDSAIAGLLGVAAMVWVGIMTDVDAFELVDWNVMAILASVWIIASISGRTRMPVGFRCRPCGCPAAARGCWS